MPVKTDRMALPSDPTLVVSEAFVAAPTIYSIFEFSRGPGRQMELAPPLLDHRACANNWYAGIMETPAAEQVLSQVADESHNKAVVKPNKSMSFERREAILLKIAYHLKLPVKTHGLFAQYRRQW